MLFSAYYYGWNNSTSSECQIYIVTTFSRLLIVPDKNLNKLKWLTLKLILAHFALNWTNIKEIKKGGCNDSPLPKLCSFKKANLKLI